MLGQIVPQNGHVVKDVLEQEECSLEWCHEPVFRAGSLCWDHFIAEATAAWDDWAAERRTALEPLGYIFGDLGEVLA